MSNRRRSRPAFRFAFTEQLVAAALCAPEPLASKALESLDGLIEHRDQRPDEGPCFLVYGEQPPCDREWEVASRLLRLRLESWLTRQNRIPVFVLGDADSPNVCLYRTAVDRNVITHSARTVTSALKLDRLIDLLSLVELARAIHTSGPPALSVGLHAQKGIEIRFGPQAGTPHSITLVDCDLPIKRYRSTRGSIARTTTEHQWNLMTRLDEGITVVAASAGSVRSSQSPIEVACFSAALGFTKGALQRLQSGDMRMPAMWVTTLAHSLWIGSDIVPEPTLELELQRRLVEWSGAWLLGSPARLQSRPGDLRTLDTDWVQQLIPALPSGSDHLGTSEPSDR